MSLATPCAFGRRAPALAAIAPVPTECMAAA